MDFIPDILHGQNWITFHGPTISCYDTGMQNIDLEKLKDLRHALLALHKELLEVQKQNYEDKHGKIKTTGEYFLLVTSNESFQWLRGLSALIASMDELLENAAPADPNQIQSMLDFIKSSLTPDHEQTEFAGLYFQALQKHPAVAVAHGQVITRLKQIKG
jgi:hypothetical protein